MPSKKDPTIEAVRKYARLTTQLRTLVSAHNREVKELKELIGLIEIQLLKHFKDNEIQNVQIPEGTVFKSKKPKLIAKVTDREGFLQWMRMQDAFYMMDISANKTAIQEYLDANKQAPPGIFVDKIDHIQFRKKGESFDNE